VVNNLSKLPIEMFGIMNFTEGLGGCKIRLQTLSMTSRNQLAMGPEPILSIAGSGSSGNNIE
jgi:hypothetical protein